MKKKLSQKQSLLCACLTLLFLGLVIFLFLYRYDEKRFSRITSKLFTEEMTSNTLNMHYTLATPADFGIYNYEPTLSCYSAADVLAGKETLTETLKELQSVNPQKLDVSDAYLHTLLTRSLENSLELNNYLYFSEPLSPSSGMQSQLPILLAEYTFRTRKDVEDYLALLDQTDEYFSSLLTFEQEKATMGMLMPAAFLQDVRKQCDTIVSLDILNSGTHFLQTTFRERIETLYHSGVISAADVQKYLVENDRLLKTVLVPAYTALGDGLLILEDESIFPTGLATYPDGQAYYEALLISETGSYRSVEEIKKMLVAQFSAEYDAIRNILNAHPEIATSYTGNDLSDFPFNDAEHMLLDLQKRIKSDFPALPDGSTTIALKAVSPNLEDYCAPAFYLTTPIDATDANSIYINRAKTPDGLSLYTTLAHEGYPGHLYQNVYFNRSCIVNRERPARHMLWYGGYMEGWALYVEFRSYDYAAKLYEEYGNPANAQITQLEKHNRSLQLCLYSLLDILIHYEGASYGEIADFLSDFGISDSASAKSVYNYLVQNPCNYLKYYLGYLEILELQKDAVETWATDYSDYRFHRFYLDCGPSDFSSLSERLMQ